VNARRVGDTAQPSTTPHTYASPLARFARHDGPAMWRGLRSSHLQQASSITRVQVLGQTGLDTAISIDQSYGPTICRLPPANAMTDVTQVVLLLERV